MLNTHTKPFITYDEIKNIYRLNKHKEVVDLVKKLIAENKIRPVETSKPTILHEQIYTKYRIIKEKSDEEIELLYELNYKIHSRLNIEYYRKNLEQYRVDRSAILELSNYLITKQNCLSKKVSINERSYEIFTDEKFIASRVGATILGNLKINIVEDFNVYKTPEPFVYLSMKRIPPQNILIIENKDTYVTISKMLLDNKLILGERIDTIIFGSGRKINNSFKGIVDDTTLEYLTHKENKFYYWGDIDKAGFNIFSSFHEVYSSLQKIFSMEDIVLFEVAYRMMIKKCKNKSLRDIPKDQNFDYEKGIFYIQNIPLRNQIYDILSCNKYIPQEAITMYDMEV